VEAIERLLGFRCVGAAEHRRRSTLAIIAIPRRTEYVVRYNFRATGTCFIGVDLVWREASADLVANETGVAVIDRDGQIHRQFRGDAPDAMPGDQRTCFLGAGEQLA
jgi:hypothetical protein